MLNTGMKVTHLDHLVLTVQDIEATVAFYTSVMGMEKEVFGEGRIALKFGNQKINLHEQGNELQPHANTPTPGSANLCFVTMMALDKAMNHVENCGVEILIGPVIRTGATGSIRSFYFRDPDSNLIEIANEIDN